MVHDSGFSVFCKTTLSGKQTEAEAHFLLLPQKQCHCWVQITLCLVDKRWPQRSWDEWVTPSLVAVPHFMFLPSASPGLAQWAKNFLLHAAFISAWPSRPSVIYHQPTFSALFPSTPHWSAAQAVAWKTRTLHTDPGLSSESAVY